MLHLIQPKSYYMALFAYIVQWCHFNNALSNVHSNVLIVFKGFLKQYFLLYQNKKTTKMQKNEKSWPFTNLLICLPLYTQDQTLWKGPLLVLFWHKSWLRIKSNSTYLALAQTRFLHPLPLIERNLKQIQTNPGPWWSPPSSLSGGGATTLRRPQDPTTQPTEIIEHMTFLRHPKYTFKKYICLMNLYKIYFYSQTQPTEIIEHMTFLLHPKYTFKICI